MLGIGDFETEFSRGDVIIGNDVWIGYGATILSGVIIGDGAIIGAGAVISKSIEPYSIMVGNPAKLIKKRFSNKTIKFLNEIKWWNWDIDKIKRNIHLLEHSPEELTKDKKNSFKSD
jgi:virginiamycin A acetyltransferase